MPNKLDYNDLSKKELLERMGDPSTPPKDMIKINRALRSVLRLEEAKLQEEEKKAREDSIEQQRQLKGTKDTLLQTRKEMSKSFADMNKTINTMSMLKNLDSFEIKAATFLGKQKAFTEALQAHLDKLREVKGQDADN